MNVFAISDLHLSAAVDKPMDVFGGNWFDYWNVIKSNWRTLVKDEDVVLIAGDISWAMTLDEAIPDLMDIASLPGKKIIIKGNHDYWWSSVSKIRGILPEEITVLQNDAVKVGRYVIFGSRGWACPDKAFTEEDEKIYRREAGRLALSLDAARRLQTEGDELIAMMHFPPFNVRREDSEYTRLFESEGIHTVVYGHLHGKQCRADKKYVKNGVTYLLTSCDQINNMPVKVAGDNIDK